MFQIINYLPMVVMQVNNYHNGAQMERKGTQG
jgi:hypothetical protein